MSKELALVLENRVAGVSSEFVQTSTLCGSQAQYYLYTADGAAPFKNTISFNSIVPVGSLNQVLMGRRVFLKYKVQITSTPVADAVSANKYNHMFPTDSFMHNSAYGNNPVNSGLRALPLQSVCDNILFQINGQNISVNQRMTLDAMQRLLDKKELMKLETPCRPDDVFNLYPAKYGTDQILNTVDKSTHGFTRNSIYAASYVAGAGATDPSIWTFDVCEPLLVPGATSLYQDTMLANVNNLSVTLSFPKIDDMVVAAPYYAASPGVNQLAYNDTLSIQINSAFLEIEYQAIDPNLVPIPKIVTYPYQQLYYQPKAYTLDVAGAITARAAGTSTKITVTSDTLRLLSAPKLIMFNLRPAMQSRTPDWADASLALANERGCVNINYGTRSGCLSQLSASEIHAMSVENGNKQSWSDFSMGAGAYTVVSVVNNIGVNAEGGDLLVGEGGSVNCQIQATYTFDNVYNSLQGSGTNTYTDAENFEFNVVILYEGTLGISGDSCVYSLSSLSNADVEALIKAKSTPVVNAESIKKELNGKGLYGDQKNVLHKAVKRRGGVITMA